MTVMRNFSKLRKCRNEIVKANIVMTIFAIISGALLPILIMCWENMIIRVITTVAFISVLTVALHAAISVNKKQKEYNKLKNVFCVTIIPH